MKIKLEEQLKGREFFLQHMNMLLFCENISVCGLHSTENTNRFFET